MLSRHSHPAPSSPNTVIADLGDELHDIRRVLAQGQEEDLQCALERVLNRVEELSSLLKTAIRTQTELETQLNLAKSNLQLVICNNEMLEEALKRETPSNARDVGWRRWSAREVQNHNTENKSDERPKSLDYGPLNESGKPAAPSSAAAVLINGVKQSPSTSAPPPSTAPLAGQENRFFKFRFSSSGSGAASTRSPSLSPHASHLTSPSLSSLVPNAREKEIEELQEQLERERRAHKAADAAKTALEAEIESLSQALFEEANKMVATERMKRAETEAELNQIRLEKDALHQALKLVEGENGRLRSANVSSALPLGPTDLSESLSQSSVALPPCSSPKPPSPRPPSRTSTSRVTTPIVPLFEIPGHITDFVLEPAPKPPLAGLHRRSASLDKLGVTGLSVSSLKESLPVIMASPSVPLLPEEPSPWADVAS